jgi:SAM-dependent methyltransferase
MKRTSLPVAARTARPLRPGKAERYLVGVPEPARDVLRRLLAGDISGPVALAGLLFALGSAAEVEALLYPLANTLPQLADLSELLRRNPERLARIAPLLPDHPEAEGRGEAAIEACRLFFDRAVRTSEEASVALYSLGDPEILDEGTREIVDLFARWGLLAPDRSALDIGCGIGRFEVALSSELLEIWGIDISAGMIAAARRRAAGLGNVHFEVGSGRDLASFPDRRFDLVLAIDSFPYIQQAGSGLVAAHFAEVARVLKPGGDFALLNFSYTGDLDDDRAGFTDLCEENGLVVEVAGLRPFTLWDGSAFLARRERR